MIRNRQTTFLSMEPVHIPSGDFCKEAQKLKPQNEFVGGCMLNIRLFNQNDDRKVSTICIIWLSVWNNKTAEY